MDKNTEPEVFTQKEKKQTYISKKRKTDVLGFFTEKRPAKKQQVIKPKPVQQTQPILISGSESESMETVIGKKNCNSSPVGNMSINILKTHRDGTIATGSASMGNLCQFFQRPVRRREETFNETGTKVAHVSNHDTGIAQFFNVINKTLETRRDRKKGANYSKSYGHFSRKRQFVTGCTKHIGTDSEIYVKIPDVQPRERKNRKLMDQLDESSLSNCQIGLESVRIYAGELFAQYMGANGRYVSDVCVPGSSHDNIQFLHELRTGLDACDEKTRNQFRIVSFHGDHIHVAHVCPYSNSSCRCLWLQRSGIWRRYRRARYRRRVFVADFSVSDWEDVVGYFTSKGHAVQDVEGGGTDGRLCVRLKDLQVRSNIL